MQHRMYLNLSYIFFRHSFDSCFNFGILVIFFTAMFLSYNVLHSCMQRCMIIVLFLLFVTYLLSVTVSILHVCDPVSPFLIFSNKLDILIRDGQVIDCFHSSQVEVIFRTSQVKNGLYSPISVVNER